MPWPALIKRLLIPLRGIAEHPLTRHHQLRAVARFVSWQLRSRLYASVDVPFVNRAQLRVSRGMNGLTGNIYCGLHEFESMGFLLHMLRPDDLFVDVGANAGTYTVLAGKAIGCPVIAIEPDESARAALLNNIALNGITAEVEVHAVIVGAEAGSLMFTNHQGAENHVATAADAASVTRSMPVDTLDRILRGRVPVLIKLDIEGYELKALQGADKTLAEPGLRALIVEINGYDARYHHHAKDLAALLHAHGFRAYGYEPMQRALARVEPLDVVGNVLFLRDPPVIAERVANAPSFSLPAWNLSI